MYFEIHMKKIMDLYNIFQFNKNLPQRKNNLLLIKTKI